MVSASEPAGGPDDRTESITRQHGRPLNKDSPWAKQNVLTFGTTANENPKLRQLN